MTASDRERIATAPMALAWRDAATDLGITFESPFMVRHPAGGLWCAGRLPDFGSATGTIIASRECDERILDIADEQGFFAPGLSPAHYERYVRDLFIEALNDWGWFGVPAKAPPWFAGGLGRHGGQKKAVQLTPLRRTASENYGD
jgi:hypothetical protein